MQRARFTLLFVLILLAAAALRLPQLATRPMHVDEAVQAAKTGALLERGDYRYNPAEFHGPTLYYATLPVLWLSGCKSFATSNEIHYRLVSVLFGLALIALLWLLRDALGPAATLLAATLTAASPLLVYYSRYYIQEVLLVCFTLLLLAALWRAAMAPHTRSRCFYALLAGAALGLMHATKETFVLAFACLSFALLLTRLRSHVTSSHPTSRLHSPLSVLAQVASALLLTAGVSALFYSSFFTHPRGVIDSFAAFAPYFSRAGGTGSAGVHDHPWFYYLQLTAWYHTAPGPHFTEAFIWFGALIGAATALRRTPRTAAAFFQHALALYALLLTLVYCAIPYKTPWAFLGAWHALVLLSALGYAALLQHPRSSALRWSLLLFIALATLHLGVQSWRGATRFGADPRNPYVYAHTSSGFMQLVERLNTFAQLAPHGQATLVQVVAPEYWPLPWYLRAWPQVGYYAAIPAALPAPLIIAGPAQAPQLQPRLPGYITEFYALRPGVLLELYIAPDLFHALLRARGTTP